MRQRPLGSTGLSVPVVGFGAGPVPALMTGADASAQARTVARAVECGIDWFDTAPGYGQGQSEASLGRALRELGLAQRVRIATKVRLEVADLDDIEGAVRWSLRASQERLGVERIALLQLHNGTTRQRGAIASSLAVADVLAVRDVFARLRAEGLVGAVGLTGTGDADALVEVLASGGFDTIQASHHLLGPADAGLLSCCRDRGVAVFAIRVFAGGALLGQPPSTHTLRTPYFPLALYEDERRRAEELAARLGGAWSLKELAIRFAVGDPAITSALIGFSSPEQVEEVAALAERGPLPDEALALVS